MFNGIHILNILYIYFDNNCIYILKFTENRINTLKQIGEIFYNNIIIIQIDYPRIYTILFFYSLLKKNIEIQNSLKSITRKLIIQTMTKL
jgi:hypothetical protein